VYKVVGLGTNDSLEEIEEIEKTPEDLEDETLQGMLTVNGLGNCIMKGFFGIDNDQAFDFLSRNIARFTINQRSQLVDAGWTLSLHRTLRSLHLIRSK
jgi:hypothetical protein